MTDWCGIEFRLQWQNFTDLVKFRLALLDFCRQDKRIFLQLVRIVHILPSGHGGLQSHSGETNDRSQRTKYQQLLLPSQALDQQRLERLAFPPTLLSRANLDNLRQCSVQSTGPTRRRCQMVDRAETLDLLLVGTWPQNVVTDYLQALSKAQKVRRALGGSLSAAVSRSDLKYLKVHQFRF